MKIQVGSRSYVKMNLIAIMKIIDPDGHESNILEINKIIPF